MSEETGQRNDPSSPPALTRKSRLPRAPARSGSCARQRQWNGSGKAQAVLAAISKERRDVDSDFTYTYRRLVEKKGNMLWFYRLWLRTLVCIGNFRGMRNGIYHRLTSGAGGT
jgi:hypothetical protein